MSLSRWKPALLLLGICLVPGLLFMRARGSDHADTPDIAKTPGADLTDVYIFPSPNDPNNVVLIMNSHPLIASGSGATTVFDPDVLYQFKIDTSNPLDGVEDLVLQFRFSGTNPASQQVQVFGPAAPVQAGTVSQYLATPDPTTGTINST